MTALVLALVFGLAPGASADDAPNVPAEPRPLCDHEDPSTRVRVAPHLRVPSPSVRVASYNLLFARGTSNESLDARVPLIVDAIAGARVDVVGVQEVERMTSRGATTARVAAGLADLTGVRWHWCWFMASPAAPGEPDTNIGGGGPTSDLFAQFASGPLNEAEWRMGEGILSRFPIVESGAHRLPGRVAAEIEDCAGVTECALERGVESRVAIRGVVATPTGPLHVLSTHLSHTVSPASDETRLRQVEALLEWADGVASARHVPMALVGDFNSREGSPVHEAVLDAGFVDTFRARNPSADGFTSSQSITAPAPTVRSRIDYVFARGQECRAHQRSWWAKAPRTAASRVFGDTPAAVGDGFLWPSDHYGVVSDLRTLPARTVAGCVLGALRR